jgi:hypothetical protein
VYPDWGLRDFPHSLQSVAWKVPWNRTPLPPRENMVASFHVLTYLSSMIIFPPSHSTQFK